MYVIITLLKYDVLFITLIFGTTKNFKYLKKLINLVLLEKPRPSKNMKLELF